MLPNCGGPIFECFSSGNKKVRRYFIGVLYKNNRIINESNCWHSVKATSIELLIDSAAYFKEFFKACSKAEKGIILTGWEMEELLLLNKWDSRLPDSLVEFFISLAQRKPNLNIETIVWEPGFYLNFGRKPRKKSRWSKPLPRNFRHFRDSSEFLFGARHEKFALIDGNIAFIGGIDITKGRWDDRDHKAERFYRRLPGGERYKPRHDMQIKIEGNLDRKILGVADRRIDGKLTKFPFARSPEGHFDVHFSRTEPVEKAFEIERLYLDAIRKAQNYIYLENQFFSNKKIARALKARLQEVDGPEVILCMPMTYSGFFEKAVYETSRDRLIRELRRSDKYGRFKAYYPSIPGESKELYVVVHSKFMAVDDRFLTIGSANLNSRSMRVDTEINASVEATGEGGDFVKNFVKDSVADLLGEHLDSGKEAFQISYKEQDKSLISAIEKLRSKSSRTLEPIPYLNKGLFHKLVSLLTPFIDIGKGIPKHG